MAYQIEYAYTCHIGKVRNNNEDNFWCCGDSLEVQNQGMSHIRSGRMKQSEYPLLAVFDGMGGESCGEMAAFLAAESCGTHYKTAKEGIKNDPENFLRDLCENMNREICNYGQINKINSMGTTAAILAFSRDAVYGCNLGDSRIYKSDNEKFCQISEDHVLGHSLFGKAPLTLVWKKKIYSWNHLSSGRRLRRVIVFCFVLTGLQICCQMVRLQTY